VNRVRSALAVMLNPEARSEKMSVAATAAGAAATSVEAAVEADAEAILIE
jgi:hypothetical protein